MSFIIYYSNLSKLFYAHHKNVAIEKDEPGMGTLFKKAPQSHAKEKGQENIAFLGFSAGRTWKKHVFAGPQALKVFS